MASGLHELLGALLTLATETRLADFPEPNIVKGPLEPQ
jgi:hypothetical protein